MILLFCLLSSVQPTRFFPPGCPQSGSPLLQTHTLEMFFSVLVETDVTALVKLQPSLGSNLDHLAPYNLSPSQFSVTKGSASTKARENFFYK